MTNGIIEKLETAESETPGKIFRLLDLVRKGGPVIIRDDHYDFPTILDVARSHGRRLVLIDSGRFNGIQMESLGRVGVSFYSSDDARTDIEEIGLIRKACSKGGSFLAFFLNAGLDEGDRPGKIPLPLLKRLAEGGVYFHLSNLPKKRDGSPLVELSRCCRQGGSWLVYYHHGSLDPFLHDLAAAGAWIHLSDQSLTGDEDLAFFRELAGHGKRLVLIVESLLPESFLRYVYRAGVYLIFKTPPLEPSSRRAALEKKAGRKSLNFRAYYISTAFLP